MDWDTAPQIFTSNQHLVVHDPHSEEVKVTRKEAKERFREFIRNFREKVSIK